MGRQSDAAKGTADFGSLHALCPITCGGLGRDAGDLPRDLIVSIGHRAPTRAGEPPPLWIHRLPPSCLSFITHIAMDYTPPLSDSGYGTPMPGQAVHVPPIKAKSPFVAVQHRPTADDGLFHVLLVSSGARASSQLPYIAGALSKVGHRVDWTYAETQDPQIALQIVATERSLRYYSQQDVDAAVRHTWNLAPEASTEFGVRIWSDADDAAGSSVSGVASGGADTQSIDPILHVELHKWADIVVVAPCSADMLAKLVQGLSGNLAVSISP